MAINMVDINPSISIITLNINGLNMPMKRQIIRVGPEKEKHPTIYVY